MIAKRYHQLFKAGAASELQLLTAQNRAEQRRNDILTVEREVNQLNATANANISSYKMKLRQEIESNLRRIANLDREITQGKLDLSRINIKAPIDGTVFNLRVSKGSLIEKNEQDPLLQLIPQDNLQAKVYIPNHAIGFIQAKQRADISLTAFRASDYNICLRQSRALAPMHSPLKNKVLGTSSGTLFSGSLELSRQTLEISRGQFHYKQE